VGKPTILIVEDEAVIVRILEIRLTQMGFQIVGTASSGEEAVSMAEEHRPDVVLMDIVLDGEMDGIEAAGIIQSRFSIPSIYTTAYSEQSMINRAAKTKPLAYMIKPLNIKDLIEVLEKAFPTE
jgi:YesN/AraC family two-component response regulator